MPDLSFKISDLETIPSYKDEIANTEKIALENTYFLSYSHTIHGMNYVTKNYKIPLHLLREDLKAHLDSIIVDSKLIINGFDNIKEFNIKSNDFIIDESASGNKLDININSTENFIQGGKNIIVSKTNSSWNINSIPIQLESSDNSIILSENQNEYKWDIKAKAAPYYISLLDKDVYNKGELLYLDKVDKRSIYIIAKDNLDYREQRSIGLNFIGYLEAENKDDAICSFKLYLNTVGCDRNTTLSGMYLKWAMGPDNNNYYSPTFLPGKIYSITFTSIPIRVFQGTSTEEDDIKYYYNGRAIIGQIDWFISY